MRATRPRPMLSSPHKVDARTPTTGSAAITATEATREAGARCGRSITRASTTSSSTTWTATSVVPSIIPRAFGGLLDAINVHLVRLEVVFKPPVVESDRSPLVQHVGRSAAELGP